MKPKILIHRGFFLLVRSLHNYKFLSNNFIIIFDSNEDKIGTSLFNVFDKVFKYVIFYMCSLNQEVMYELLY